MGVGLSTAEVEARVAAGRVNRAPPSPARTLRQILRANVLTRFNAILGALFLVVVVVGPIQDQLFGAVLVANTVIGIVQELRARRTLSRLAVLSAARAEVVRDGRREAVAVEEVVEDDVLELAAGDQVVVDGEVLATDGLELDEALLTGEGEPVAAALGATVRSGTVVVAGAGRIRATHVGAASYAAALEREASRFSLVRSELQQGTNDILRIVSWVMVPTATALVVTQLVRVHQPLAQAVRGSVAGVAAMVPEGLVLLTSVAFAVGALRLARRRVLVQELAAVEGLARVDVVCLDKTGTLTLPGMRLVALEPLGDRPREEVEGVLAALAAADPAPNASIRAIGEAGGEPVAWRVSRRIPFSSARRWSAVSFEGHGTWVLGAPEVFPAAPARAARGGPAATLEASTARTLLLGSVGREPDVAMALEDVDVVARLSLAERIRPDAAATVAYLLGQGVRIKVLSGDAPATVAAIAAEVGVTSPSAVDASSLADERALAEALEKTDVLGRVRPDQKLEAVRALQASGHVVAMIGDGVNDVQALKQADLGIAMGSGSPSSRAVARVVLLDSAFSSVPQILAEGRRVVANIGRVARLFIVKTVYAALLAVVVAAAAVPFPFFPRHLTIVSTLTIGVPGFFLALAAGAPRAAPGFVRRVAAFAVPAGICAAAATFAAYTVARGLAGVTTVEARTAALLSLGAVGVWVLALVAAPLDAARGALVVAMAAGFAVPFATPELRRLFGVAVPTEPILLASVVTALSALVLLSLWRALAARRPPGPAAGPGGDGRR